MPSRNNSMGKSKKKDHQRRHTAPGPYDNIQTPARQIRDLPPLIRTEQMPGRMLERQVRFGQDRSSHLNTPLKKGTLSAKAPIRSPYPTSREVVRHEDSSSESSEEVCLSEVQDRASSRVLHADTQMTKLKQSDAQALVVGSIEDLQAQIVTLKQAAKDAAEKAYTAEILVDLYRNRWLALKTHLA